jgi:ribosomal-protein-serine acetyltransferase
MGRLAGTVVNDLILKDLSLEQAEPFFIHVQENRAIYQDAIPFVSRTHSVEDMRANIARNLQRQAAGLAELYTLWDGERMAGYFLIREKEPEAAWAEIGYMLGQTWQRKGISQIICGLLIAELFVHQGMRKVVICCTGDNAASIGLARKLGFRQEGSLRAHFVVNGKIRDMLYFGLLKDEWEQE